MALAACSAANTNGDDDGAGASGGQTSTGIGGHPSGGGDIFSGTGGGLNIGGNTGECNGEITCSADLHNILCDGVTIASCPANEACIGGTCGQPCEAATAAKSTVGCEYYAANPDVLFSAGACYAVFVANTWTTPVTLGVEWDGVPVQTAGFARIPKGSGQAITYDPLPNGQLPTGEIAVLFLAQFGPETLYTPACPAGVTPAVTGVDASLHATGIAKSFRITADSPVAAYDIFPYGGGRSAITSATLLIPTSAWDTNYIGVAPYDTTITDVNFHSWLQIIAAEDGTAITISPTYDIVGGGGIPATGSGQPITVTIQAGDVMQLSQAQELSGSPIQANKPIGVVGGNRCMVIPDSNYGACDAGHQMLAPVKALGSEYVAVRYRNRYPNVSESVPWRMVGAVNGTQLTYEPSPPPGAPSALSVGQVVSLSADQPFVVRSQDADHPFYMSGHMSGCSLPGGPNAFDDCRGDPETVNVIPSAQYLSNYVFFTDPTYPETHLVIIRKKGPTGFSDVDLDCAGVLTGWQPVGSAGDYQYTRIDLVTGNFQPQGACNNGRHEISSDATFAVTVWGWGSAASGGDISNPNVPGFFSQAVSYGYPAGAGVASITQIEVPPTPN